MKKTSFIWSLTGVALVLGFMLSVQLSTHVSTAKTSDPSQSYLDLMNEISAQSDQNRLVDNQIAKVREQLDNFKDAGPTQKQQEKALQQDAEQVNQAAGLTSVSGPGITITIDGPSGDFNSQMDVAYIVNILFSDGAQAISINNQRLTTISPIREIDANQPTAALEVNLHVIALPYKITAVGNVNDMLSILNVEQIDQALQLEGMTYSVSQSTKVTVPAYTGQLPGQYAKEVTGQ